jgi:hypothetical protein
VTVVTKLALQVAQEALEQGAVSLQQVFSVFASAAGNGDIIDKICTDLTVSKGTISPTDFHNSVHNAPAGYWAIATHCSKPSVSLSAYDESFSVGLLEAMTQALTEHTCVLLVAYDHPLPFPLSEQRYLYGPFATALLLNPKQTVPNWARLTLQLTQQDVEDCLPDGALERLRAGNPAARSLPLLQAVARSSPRRVILPYCVERKLIVDVAP